MKKVNFILYSLIFSLIFSCKDINEISPKIDEILVKFKVIRFDKIFYETPIDSFKVMRKKYSLFFEKNTPDSSYTNKISNPIYKELYTEVQKKFGNFNKDLNEIETLFKFVKYHFPEEKIPENINTLISEMDYHNKIIFTDSILVVSLDLYLGKEHKFYEFPSYLKHTFEKNQILPDIVDAFGNFKIQKPIEKTFLSQMIYFGKILYLKDLFLPNYEDYNKIGFEKEKFDFCVANELNVWTYFLEQKLLYDTNYKTIQRFIEFSPFSKFYLEIDQKTPGRIGQWIGWQIVKSYMQSNEVSLEKMMQEDANMILQRSKYKPKK
jgi:gliding motility-associated lipoprotein GldB